MYICSLAQDWAFKPEQLYRTVTRLQAERWRNRGSIPGRTRFISSPKRQGIGKCKGKGKAHPITGHEDPEREKRYSSTLSLTSAVDGVGGQRPLYPRGKTRYLLCRRLGRPYSRSGQVQKISPPTGFDPRTVQPIGSRYTDWATRAHTSETHTLN